ncbi:MAG: hypothetical protein IT318_07635 [Anaerolineales bacterium]|nr:hypothetical protein [Anaerolineales bacterium]
MIRSFDWRDVGLVKTLADQGVCLDSETGLTQGNHPLQHALLAYLMPMAGAPTLIWRADGNHHAVFGQLRHRPGEEHARVLYIAPVAENAVDGWQRVIERLAVEAGERRAQNLIAEVNEKSPEFESLRQAGFAIYARQTLWQLPAGPPPEALGAPGVPLRPATRADAIGVSTLYCNVVPRLVQQVEPGPQHIDRGYVLQDSGELMAYLDVRRGPQGIWVEPFLHPEADDLSEAVLQACLRLLPGRKEKPLYVCVRRYQNWLQEVVKRVGFAPLGTQAVMVKRLAVRLAEPVLKPLPVVEGQVPTPITSVRCRSTASQRRAAPPSHHGPARRSGWPTHAKANHR